MGRPMKFDRSEAVETAMKTFRKKGYKATSVSDLAAAMSITRSSFYNSFKSRRLLFEEALTLYLADEPDRKLKEPIPAGGASDAVRTFFKNICNNFDAAREHCGCMIMNSLVTADENEPAPESVQQFIDDKRSKFKVAIEQAVYDKTIQAVEDVDMLVETMIAFMIGLNMIARSNSPAGHLWTIARTYLDSIGFTESPEKR